MLVYFICNCAKVTAKDGISQMFGLLFDIWTGAVNFVSAVG